MSATPGPSPPRRRRVRTAGTDPVVRPAPGGARDRAAGRPAAGRRAAGRRAAGRRAAVTPARVAVRGPAGAVRRPPTSRATPGGIVSVRGIQVASSIAGSVESLLAAATADGVSLSGGGYRDPSSQISLRRAHCGTSRYAVYEMPASQCTPPTARPGTSMHEQGLAIDFTYNGSLIRSRSNAGFRWLAANAGRFGLANLPSEPWHWSTNGR
ncbi:MAG: M15 family metallopeptidase [Acidimicrobiia bacterium]|nr:M15 family metallopeptidase [Acidimicrobiia bacterium]